MSADRQPIPELLAVGPGTGGVGDMFAHATAEMAGAGPWRVTMHRVEESQQPFWRAIVTLLRGRRVFAHADALHVEFGSNDKTVFWLALLLTATRRTVTILPHDYPLLVHDPAAGLLSSSRRWTVIVGHRLLSPILDRFLKRWLLRRAGAVAVMSAEAKVRWAPLVRGRLLVVPHGSFPVSGLEIAPSDGRHILFAGFIGPSKGVDVLLEAWERVSPQSPLPMVIAGSSVQYPDPYLEEMKARSMHLRNPPEWSGYLPENDLQRLIGAAAVVVLPYRESNPASGILARAMLEGRAIVATRVPATAAVIRDGIDGILVKPDDSEALAGALADILADPVARDRLGARARERASELFSSARRNTLLLQAYEHCRSLDLTRGR